MSGCGCTGHYHNGACGDQNPVFWKDGREPVTPTPEEITEQCQRNFDRLSPEKKSEVMRMLSDSALMTSCPEDRAAFLARHSK